jgi:hypothetical protein
VTLVAAPLAAPLIVLPPALPAERIVRTQFRPQSSRGPPPTLA